MSRLAVAVGRNSRERLCSQPSRELCDQRDRIATKCSCRATGAASARESQAAANRGDHWTVIVGLLVMLLRWILQKYGMTVPDGVPAGMVMVAEPPG